MGVYRFIAGGLRRLGRYLEGRCVRPRNEIDMSDFILNVDEKSEL